jgi:hypothetical protein
MDPWNHAQARDFRSAMGTVADAAKAMRGLAVAARRTAFVLLDQVPEEERTPRSWEVERDTWLAGSGGPHAMHSGVCVAEWAAGHAERAHRLFGGPE